MRIIFATVLSLLFISAFCEINKYKITGGKPPSSKPSTSSSTKPSASSSSDPHSNNGNNGNNGQGNNSNSNNSNGNNGNGYAYGHYIDHFPDWAQGYGYGFDWWDYYSSGLYLNLWNNYYQNYTSNTSNFDNNGYGWDSRNEDGWCGWNLNAIQFHVWTLENNIVNLTDIVRSLTTQITLLQIENSQLKQDLSSCTLIKQQCQSDLAIKTASLNTCTLDLSQCNQDKSILQANLQTTQNQRDSCLNDFRSCQTTLSTCQNNYLKCYSDFNLCQSNLIAAQSITTSTQASLSQCQSSSGSIQANLDSCQNTLAANPSLQTCQAGYNVCQSNVNQCQTALATASAAAGNTSTPTNPTAPSTAIDGCWLDSYGRGVGLLRQSCPAGYTFDTGLCYHNCPSDYPVGILTSCYKACATGWTMVAGVCHAPPGYDQPFTSCPPPSSSILIGNLCAVPSVDRGGIGDASLLTCSSTQELDATLCYTKCDPGYVGHGPVCWGACPAGTTSCAALCLKSGSCTDFIFGAATSIGQLAGGIAGAAGGNVDVGAIVGSTIDTVKQFTLSICSATVV